jgi:hypothetical protein
MANIKMSPAEEAQNLKETATILNDHTEPIDDWKRDWTGKSQSKEDKNWSQDDATRLRRLVRAWRQSDRDIRRAKFDAEDSKKLDKFTENISVRFEPDGSLHLIDYYGRDTAAMQFTRLIRNSQQARLRDPCLKCDKWYISKTKRSTLFCSRKCAGSAAKAAERKRKRDALLKRARKAIENFPARPARFAEMHWREWVAKAIPGISRKMLSIAVKHGELLPPKENGK